MTRYRPSGNGARFDFVRAQLPFLQFNRNTTVSNFFRENISIVLFKEYCVRSAHTLKWVCELGNGH